MFWCKANTASSNSLSAPFLTKASLKPSVTKICFNLESLSVKVLDSFSISILEFLSSFDNVSFKLLTNTYPITNYTSSVRNNAKNLQYGLQTCKFVRDSLEVIQSPSDYLECNGTGYAIIPSHIDKVNIKMTVNPTSLSGNLLSGGVTKTLAGLTLNVDNDVVINDVTPTGAITLASGFTGTIKSYMEETR